MKFDFEVAAGSIVGREHVARASLLIGKPNQDAFGHVFTKNHFVGIVCDGCSSGQHSEVGATLAARMLLRSFERDLEAQFRLNIAVPDFYNKVIRSALDDLMANLRVLAYSFGDPLGSVVNDYFLFTIVGMIVGPNLTLFFSVGDGVYAVNGQIVEIGPFDGNAPPYLGYRLKGGRIEPQVHNTTITASLETAMIGTDGTVELIARAEDKMPGKVKQVGNFEQFWKDDQFFKNSDAIRRRLALINSEVVTPAKSGVMRFPGLLGDDTTFIVLRRRKVGA